MSFVYYKEQIEYINNVIAALNSIPGPPDDLYIDVRLLDSSAERQVGRFSDEIAPDSWSYEETWDAK